MSKRKKTNDYIYDKGQVKEEERNEWVIRNNTTKCRDINQIKSQNKFTTNNTIYSDSRWQKRRLEIMQRDDFTCQWCEKNEDVELHIHHKIYKPGHKIWEYDDYELVTICKQCHQSFTEEKKYLIQNLNALNQATVGRYAEPIGINILSIINIAISLDHLKLYFTIRDFVNKIENG